MIITVLGKNHFALSMISETIAILYKDCHLDIMTNVEDCENTTIDYDFKHPSVTYAIHKLLPTTKIDTRAVIAGMSPKSREVIYNAFVENIAPDCLVPLVHPFTNIAHTVNLSKGCRIEPGVVIAPFANLGFAVLINRNASIGHHTYIGEYTNINPGAVVNGNCHIGTNVTIGAGVIINDGITIGNGSTVGAGSVVTKNIPSQVLALGVPAKVIKEI